MNIHTLKTGRRLTAVFLLGAIIIAMQDIAIAQDSFSSVVETIQPKMVKVYGAGGIRGLESYQSGFLISADGHILTAWSYVLDTDYITATLNDGRKFEATMVGADRRLEIAVLKIDATSLEFFDLNESTELQVGSRVLAFSNLYGIATGNEPTSVLHGSVSAVTSLSARRGAYKTVFDGVVYVLDAMTNNAGAVGGVLTSRSGKLAGILGKELRNDKSNVWLNYAVPVSEFQAAVSDILAGKLRSRVETNRKRPKQPMTLGLLGIALLPDVINKTPPFVQFIEPGSAADKGGLKPDDLILYIDNVVVQSRKEVDAELSFIDRLDVVRLTVQRGQQLVELEMVVD